ncbi:cytochrome c-type biogenesis protein [Pelagibius marinus]|uniref:cytochrome c-type biogenesis protein n=1 Tax=Pelagibius marinus TaxID=2762760 RepID=UPI001872254F|nr:cytochrome c-type biogenesis protein [Pelagibius marinus]
MIRRGLKPLLVVGALLFAGAAFAVEPDEMLDDPALEQRARDLSAEIRCVVCQNESIDSSNAEIARELRLLVRERLVAGDSDQQVLDYLVARYGDYVLLRPPMKPQTYLLWFGPFVVLLLGALGVFVYFRQLRAAPAQPPRLSAEEEARLARLLDEEDSGKE